MAVDSYYFRYVVLDAHGKGLSQEILNIAFLIDQCFWQKSILRALSVLKYDKW